MTHEAIIRILAAGGSMRIGLFSVDALVHMAATARSSGAMLTIVGAHSDDAMVQIAAAGKGHVTFDVVKA